MEHKIEPKDANDWGNIILNEQDPLLREIWDAGYTHIFEDFCNNEVVLIHRSKIKKCINKFEWKRIGYQLKFKSGRMPDGTIHTWISEGDGSADKFRTLILLNTHTNGK